MEERYHDDTVELIDYLRVMWWGKWIILGCFVVAVGLSVLLIGMKPVTTTYSGSMEILLRDYVAAMLPADCKQLMIIAVEPGYIPAPTRESTMTAAIGSTLPTVEDAVSGIEARLEDNRITLSRNGATSIDAVREALAQAGTVLEEQLVLALAEELDYLAKVMRLEQTGLVAQRDILQQRLSEQRDSEDPVSEALAERIADLESQIAQHQVSLDLLATSEFSDLYVLTPIGEPTVSSTTPASKFRTTAAVAGFLGLMIGVLLAFFVHYLIQIRERERGLEASDERKSERKSE